MSALLVAAVYATPDATNSASARSSILPLRRDREDVRALLCGEAEQLARAAGSERPAAVLAWLRAIAACSGSAEPRSVARASAVLDGAGIDHTSRLAIHERIFEAAAQSLSLRFEDDGPRLAAALAWLQKLLARDAHSADARTTRTRDDLTRVLGRGSLVTSLGRSFERCKRDEAPFSVLFVDVDNFKWINDAHGHAAGDAALRAIADTLSKEVRPADVVGRYGGDEFVVGLPGADAQSARRIADRLRAAVARVKLGDGERVTLSIGVGTADVREDIAEVVARADAAMYAAKAAGRNCVREYRRGMPATLCEPRIVGSGSEKV
jgi:diguanylate cyclase (GGDEF)-like protein